MKSWKTYTIWEKIKIIMLILISILFLIFAAQNWEIVVLKLIVWKFNINLFSALFFSFILGVLVSLIIARVKINALKKVIHLRNDEIKHLKTELPNKKDLKGVSEKVDQLIDGKNLKNDE